MNQLEKQRQFFEKHNIIKLSYNENRKIKTTVQTMRIILAEKF